MIRLPRGLYLAGIGAGLLNILVAVVIQTTSSYGFSPINYILGGYILGLMSMMFVDEVGRNETSLVQQ